MSTPYLDEAERCNRVALMNNGEIISLDTPQKIKASLEKDVIEIVCSQIRNAYKLVKQNFPFEVQMFGDRINIIVDEFDSDYIKIEKLLIDNSIQITNHRLITPSLENVFIHLVQEAN